MRNKIAYFDCSSGISGDMCLGALVDAGVPLKEMEKGLKGLLVKGYKLEAKKVKRGAIAATKVDVLLASGSRGQGAGSRKWKDIKELIERAALPVHIKQKGLNIFKRLFEAEGKAHGMAYDKTHLHELGAVDCVVDIFGTLTGLDSLGVNNVHVSAVNLGSGFVKTEHGRLSVPAPATAEMLKGIPVYSSDIPFELTTPTGAAILREIADGFPDMPVMNIRQIGYGAGQRDIGEQPNVLRIFIGEGIFKHPSKPDEQVTVIETNIDDMNPQIYEHVMERLFNEGALDVYLAQVIMKKGRPGVVLTVLCPEARKADLIRIILRETTSIGVRFYEASRVVLMREIKEVETEFGKIRVKVSRMDNGETKCSPEYEDCKRAARKFKIPITEVMKKVFKSKLTQGGIGCV